MKIGIALVEIERIRRLRERFGDRFLRRCFTPDEQAYAFSRRAPDPHLGGRLASKLALRNALGRTIPMRALEVSREEGAPFFRSIEGNQALGKVHLTITHTETLAIAQVLIEGD